MKSKTISCVYSATSPSGNQYIGSAKNFSKRWRQHLSALRGGRHHSRSFQRAWDKYGEDNITFSILFVCEPADLLFYEQRALDILRQKYNISPSASGTRGLKWSDESRAAIRGRKVDGALVSAGVLRNTTPEERISRARLARASWTEESIEKSRRSHIGKTQSIATREKRGSAIAVSWTDSGIRSRRISGMAGRTLSDEHKANLRKPRSKPRSEAHRRALGLAHLGKPGPWRGKERPKETREKIAATLKGRKRSPEAIAKHLATNAAKRLALLEAKAERL